MQINLSCETILFVHKTLSLRRNDLIELKNKLEKVSDPGTLDEFLNNELEKTEDAIALFAELMEEM